MDDFKKGVLVMVIFVKQHTSPDELRQVIQPLEWLGLEVSVTQGIGHTVLGLLGDVSCVDVERFLSLPQVGKRLWKCLNHTKKPTGNSILRIRAVQVGGAHIGGRGIQRDCRPLFGGKPRQVTEIAQASTAGGASFLRGARLNPAPRPMHSRGWGNRRSNGWRRPRR